MPGLRSHPGGQGGREWAVGDPFPGPTCGSGLSFSFFNDQFLVLEKKKKAKEREFEIYRKKIPVFCFRCLSFATCTHSSKLGVAPPASDSTTAPSSCSGHESRQLGCRFPVGIIGNSNFCTCSAPFLALACPPIPPHPSPPTCHSLGPQGHHKKLPLTSLPLDAVLGTGFAGEQLMVGERRTEAGGWPSTLIRFLGRTGSTVQLCSSERIYGSGLDWAWEVAESREWG